MLPQQMSVDWPMLFEWWMSVVLTWPQPLSVLSLQQLSDGCVCWPAYWIIISDVVNGLHTLNQCIWRLISLSQSTSLNVNQIKSMFNVRKFKICQILYTLNIILKFSVIFTSKDSLKSTIWWCIMLKANWVKISMEPLFQDEVLLWMSSVKLSFVQRLFIL